MTLEDIKRSKAFKAVNRVWNFLLSQWFFCSLGIFIGLAYRFPEFAKQRGTIRAEYTISYGAVAIIFLISGMSMPTAQLKVNMLNFQAHLTCMSLSFLITSSMIYGFCCAIRASHDKSISDWLLVGMIVTHACPTTISSNVVMTKQAHGNDVLTLCEVLICNILGAFITPALLQMFLTGPWEFGNAMNRPGASSIRDLYGETLKQLGLSAFVPLFVGQLIQNIFPRQTSWCMKNLKLSKVGTFMLVMIMWQSFSTAFAQNAFEEVSHISIIFLVFFNIGIYLFFTVITFLYCRPVFILRLFDKEPSESSSFFYKWSYKIFRPFYYNRVDTVAILLCGPAKTAALGVSIISSQYGSGFDRLGILLIPLVLYQAEQVMTANVLTTYMKKWIYAEEKQTNDIESNSDTTKRAGDNTGAPKNAPKSGDSSTNSGESDSEPAAVTRHTSVQSTKTARTHSFDSIVPPPAERPDFSESAH